jgi:PAS domain S-box-containing protein
VTAGAFALTLAEAEGAAWFVLAGGLALAGVTATLAVTAERRSRAAREVDRFFALSPELVIVAGFDGYWKRVNPTVEAVLGYSEREALSRPFMEFIHPDDYERTVEEAGRVMAGENAVAFENRVVCKNGSYRWIEWTVTPVPEEGVMYGIGRDVTERRRTEREQAALQRIATLVAEGVPPAELFSAVSREVAYVFSAVEPLVLATVIRFDPGPECVLVGASRPYELESIGSRWSPRELYVSTRVLRSGRSARVDQADLDTVGGPDADVLRRRGFLYQVGCPVVVEGRAWGAMTLNSSEAFPLDVDERLEGFTELVATAIADAESRDALARLADEQAALRRVATLVAEGTEPTDLFAAVAVEVAAVVGVSSGSVSRFLPDGSSVVLASHNDPGFPVGSQWRPDEGTINAAILETARPARVDQKVVSGPIAEASTISDVRSAVGAPIVVEGSVWGMVAVGRQHSDEPLPPRTETRLATFTELIATAIANAESRDALARLADEQAALRRVATLVARDAPSAEVFEAVANEVGRLLETDITIVGRYDDDGAATAIGNWSSAPGGVPVGTRSALGGRNVLTMVAETGMPARLDEYDDASGEAADIARRHGWRSSIAAPIAVEDRLWGVMLVATQRPEPFPADAEDRLAGFTELVATAIANTESHEALAQLADEQAALRRVATLVAENPESTEVFSAVAREVASVLDVRGVIVDRFEADGAQVTLGSAYDRELAGAGAFLGVGVRLPLHPGTLAAGVFGTHRAARVEDYSKLEGMMGDAARAAGVGSGCAAPIVVEGRLWGQICVFSAQGTVLPTGMEHQLDGFGKLVATAISNYDARARLRMVADEQAALRRVATRVARDAPPLEVFAGVAEEVGLLLDAGRVFVTRYEDGNDATLVAGWSATGGDVPVGLRFKVGEGGAADLVRRTGGPARVDAYVPGSSAHKTAQVMGIECAVAAPINVEGRLWGLVLVGGTADSPPPPGTEQRLAGFTELVATAIANTDSRESLAELAAEQAALRQVATLVAEGATAEELFAAVARAVAGLPGVELVAMSRFEAEATRTLVAAWGDPELARRVGSRWPLEESPSSSQILATGRPLRVDLTSGQVRHGPAAGLGVRSYVGSPIEVEGRIWGALFAMARSELPADTERRLTSFTELLATAIANAESQGALEKLADEQATLRRIATLVAQGVEPEAIFAAVSDEIGSMFGAVAGVLRFEHDPPAVVFFGVSERDDPEVQFGTRWELVDGMASAEVYRTGRPARLSAADWASRTGPWFETARRLGFQSQVVSPIIVEGSLWGVVSVNAREVLPPDTEERLEKFSELVTTAIANAESKSELAASRRRIVAASDETRRRIERDLHDGTQQRLVSLGLAVRAAEAGLPPERDDLRAELSVVADGLVAAVEDLQEISRGIHPAILSKGGLGPALQALAHRSSIPVDLQITTDARLAEPIEVAAYFVASEALANAAKHSQASRIDVSLGQRDGSLVLSVRDDGVGGADAAGGSGLTGLTDRVEALGGSIHIASRPGKGTQISAELPLAD